jgi:nucleoside-diphosphate-sugar epimerase
MRRTCDNSEWRRRYGDTPFTSVRDGFARTYDWLATHGVAPVDLLA